MTKKKGHKKQHGGWFYEEKDPYFGGVVKAVHSIKDAHDYIKNNHIISRGLPILGTIVSGITRNPEFIQKGFEYGMKASQAGYGHGRKMRGRGLPNTQPNTSDFGSCKF